MIEPLQDYFTVCVERRYEDVQTKSGIFLLNSAWVDDEEMDRFTYKRLYGTIVHTPRMYSQEKYTAIDSGMPPYRKFIGHDDIVDRINRGYRNHAEKSYYPSTFDEYECVTMADLGENVNVRPGEKVYFTPHTTEPENLCPGKIDGKDVYRLSVADVYCVVRDGKIEMQGNHVLVKPNMETWEEITTKSGIIMKPQPDKRTLEGIVVHSRHDHLIPGDRVVYLPNADCEVTIEGEKLWVMPVLDIIGTLK